MNLSDSNTNSSVDGLKKGFLTPVATKKSFPVITLGLSDLFLNSMILLPIIHISYTIGVFIGILKKEIW